MPLVGCGLSMPFPQKDLALHLPVGSEGQRLSRGLPPRLLSRSALVLRDFSISRAHVTLLMWPKRTLNFWPSGLFLLSAEVTCVHHGTWLPAHRQGCSIPEPHPGLLTAISNPVLCSTPGYFGLLMSKAACCRQFQVFSQLSSVSVPSY